MTREVNVYSMDGDGIEKSLSLPDVFKITPRADLIRDVYDNVRMNKRQPYAVSPLAGMQHSAESWGTGRARARVPRVKGSGTRRVGQGAFANFCRKGRMAHPTKVLRRWHRKTPRNTRRLACAMSVAATGNPAIVEGRGHRISGVPMLPLVVSDEIQSLEKTKDIYNLLKKLNLEEDMERVKNSKTITAGKGKYRGRRYNKRKGILVIYDGMPLKGLGSIEGVDMMNVNALNILGLAPGGTAGRLVLWTESAFLKLNEIFGTLTEESHIKGGFNLPKPIITSGSLEEYFYSPEIQSIIETPCLVPRESCGRNEDALRKAREFIDLYKRVVE